MRFAQINTRSIHIETKLQRYLNENRTTVHLFTIYLITSYKNQQKIYARWQQNTEVYGDQKSHQFIIHQIHNVKVARAIFQSINNLTTFSWRYLCGRRVRHLIGVRHFPYDRILLFDVYSKHSKLIISPFCFPIEFKFCRINIPSVMVMKCDNSTSVRLEWWQRSQTILHCINWRAFRTKVKCDYHTRLAQAKLPGMEIAATCSLFIPMYGSSMRIVAWMKLLEQVFILFLVLSLHDGEHHEDTWTTSNLLVYHREMWCTTENGILK